MLRDKDGAPYAEKAVSVAWGNKPVYKHEEVLFYYYNGNEIAVKKEDRYNFLKALQKDTLIEIIENFESSYEDDESIGYEKGYVE